jgi:hypothetical protein
VKDDDFTKEDIDHLNVLVIALSSKNFKAIPDPVRTARALIKLTSKIRRQIVKKCD